MNEVNFFVWFLNKLQIVGLGVLTYGDFIRHLFNFIVKFGSSRHDTGISYFGRKTVEAYFGIISNMELFV